MRRQGVIISLDFPTYLSCSGHLRRDAGFEGSSCDFGINYGKGWCSNCSPEVYYTFPNKCDSQLFRNICSYTITDTPRLSLHKHCSQSFKNGKGKKTVLKPYALLISWPHTTNKFGCYEQDDRQRVWWYSSLSRPLNLEAATVSVSKPTDLKPNSQLLRSNSYLTTSLKVRSRVI